MKDDTHVTWTVSDWSHVHYVGGPWIKGRDCEECRSINAPTVRVTGVDPAKRIVSVTYDTGKKP